MVATCECAARPPACKSVCAESLSRGWRQCGRARARVQDTKAVARVLVRFCFWAFQIVPKEADQFGVMRVGRNLHQQSPIRHPFVSMEFCERVVRLARDEMLSF